MTTPIVTKRSGPVLEVAIDRPIANAIDAATSRIMGEIFAGFRDDPKLRVAILTAAGEKFFCPGWDLKAAADGEPPDSDYGVGGFGGLQELPGLNKPVICAVNGLAFGGGFEIMLSCDIIIAAEHATFALPEINSGTVADAASIKLPRRIPYHVAMELLFTGRRFDAIEAKQWGLVNEIVPADGLMQRARALAAELADGPPLVFAAIKEIVRETAHLPISGGVRPRHEAASRDGGHTIRQRRPTGGSARICGKAQTALERPLALQPFHVEALGKERRCARIDCAQAFFAGVRRACGDQIEPEPFHGDADDASHAHRLELAAARCHQLRANAFEDANVFCVRRSTFLLVVRTTLRFTPERAPSHQAGRRVDLLVEVGLNEGIELARGKVTCVAECFLPVRPILRCHIAQRLDQQLLLGFEVKVDKAIRQARGLCDVLQLQACLPLLGEHRDGRLDQLLLADLAGCLTRHR